MDSETRDVIVLVAIVMSIVVAIAAFTILWSENNTVCHNEIIKEKAITGFGGDFRIVTNADVYLVTRSMYAVSSIGDVVGVCCAPYGCEIRSIEKARPQMTSGEGGWSLDYTMPSDSKEV